MSNGLGALHHMWEHHAGPRTCQLGLFRRLLINWTPSPTCSLQAHPSLSQGEGPGWTLGSIRRPAAGSALLPPIILLESISHRRGSQETFHNYNHLPDLTQGRQPNAESPFSLIFQLFQLFSDICLHLLIWTQRSDPALSVFTAYIYNWSNLMHVCF